MRTYELVLVFDSSLEIEQIETDLKRFKDIMTSESGFIRVWERWGKQRLAYEIRRRQYGYYTLVIFDTAPSVIAELERIIRLTPTILRYLITVVDPIRAPEIDEESVETLGAARPGTINTDVVVEEIEKRLDEEAVDDLDEIVDEDTLEASVAADDIEESVSSETADASEQDENKRTEDVV
ncbi:30S ribosomal protein S6 [bacterium]|nr:30S ribosomal protein S6 [bacterium]MBU1636687.1 30S ribosomal protein S6 [bacterium]MBU1919234.1 30S ribosomal protein S6 [bacterium]